MTTPTMQPAVSGRAAREIARRAQRYIRPGDVRLASGASSSWHIDGRAFLLGGENARPAGRAMLRILGPDVTCIGGPATGAIPLAMAIITQSSPPMTACFVGPVARQLGTAQRIEGNLGPRVAIIDDTCTTGASILDAIRAVEDAGYSYQNLLTITNHQPTPDTSGPPSPDDIRITSTPELDTEHRIQYWIDYPDGSGSAVWIDLDENEPPTDPDVRARALELVKQYGQSRTPRANAS